MPFQFDDVALNELDECEMFDAASKFNPGLTWEQWRPYWAAFRAWKEAEDRRLALS